MLGSGMQEPGTGAGSLALDPADRWGRVASAPHVAWHSMMAREEGTSVTLPPCRCAPVEGWSILWSPGSLWSPWSP